MKTPNLIEVPKSAPSARDKLNAFKTANGIETFRSTGMTRREHPWQACRLPSARKFGYGVTASSSLMECILKVGRLLEEAGVLVTGETERDAIRTLCKNVGIQCMI